VRISLRAVFNGTAAKHFAARPKLDVDLQSNSREIVHNSICNLKSEICNTLRSVFATTLLRVTCGR
jgi:hypothetical protein